MPWSDPDPTLKSKWASPTPQDKFDPVEQRVAQKFLPSSVSPYVTPLLPHTVAERAVNVMSPFADVAAGAMLADPLTAPAAPLVKYGVPAATAYGYGLYEAPSGQRFQRANEELEKYAMGTVLAKPIEYLAQFPARYFNQAGMLRKSAGRIMRGMKAVFKKYPLDTPNNMEGILRDVSGGNLKEAADARLGKLRDELKKDIPAYTPAQPGQPGKPATMTLGGPGPTPPTPGTPASGEPFTVYDPVKNANDQIIFVPREVSIGEGIDHVQEMNGRGYTGGGSDAGGAGWEYRKAGHMSRDSINTRLDQIGVKWGHPLAGQEYKLASGESGLATILQDASTNAKNSVPRAGVAYPVVDQRLLDRRIAAESEHLRRLIPKEKFEALQRAVAPTGASAVRGRWLLPESRRMYGWPTQLGMNVPHMLAPEIGRVVPSSDLGGAVLQKFLSGHGVDLPVRDVPGPGGG